MSGWDYVARSAEVDAINAARSATLWAEVQRNQALAAERKAQLKPKVVGNREPSAAQVELFSLLGQEGLDHVEQLLEKLPSLRQREHFRRLYLKAYHSMKDDGSLAFQFGTIQRKKANLYLCDLLENRLGKVFAQYRYDLSYLSMTLQEKWQWAVEQGTVLHDQQLNPAITHDVCREHEKAEKRTLPFYLMTESKVQAIAEHLSFIFGQFQADVFQKQAQKNKQSGVEMSDHEIELFVISLYRRLGELSESIGLPLPYWATFSFNDGNAGFRPNMAQIEISLNKSVCEKWWFKQLRKAQKQMVEHLAIACGEVRKGEAIYISAHGFKLWQAQRKKNMDFLQNQIVVNIDDEEEQMELLEMYKKSSANPSIRYQEMMCSLRGLEEWADENGHQALFFTLTAPSAYHAQLSNGGQNPKWNGSSPKQTQVYLNRVWTQYRALLKKRDIAFYGMRVAEAHHDGTPHWHILFYVVTEHAEEAERLFREKALEEDGDEAGAKKHRAKVEKCDKAKGSATAYIVKYIAKNLGGTADRGDKSDEFEAMSLKENAGRVKAWASMWGIRQFQFFGVSSIGVWRELRRLKANEAGEGLENLRIAADMGEFALFLDMNGGGGASRNLWRAKLDYEQREPNRYGEVRKKIIGICDAIGQSFRTRLKQWVIRKKPMNVADPEQGAVSQKTGRSPAWTCVSNCNRSENEQRVTQYLQQHENRLNRLKMAMGWRGIDENSFTNLHYFILLNGGEVQFLGKEYISFDGNEVVFSRKKWG